MLKEYAPTRTAPFSYPDVGCGYPSSPIPAFSLSLSGICDRLL